MAKSDHYASFQDLVSTENLGVDFTIRCLPRGTTRTLILAPHGGSIEPGTSQLARAIAGNDFSLYLFEGIKAGGNGVLHVTSHHFDEPSCLEMLSTAETVVAIHGCSGAASRICVGGLDEPLVAALTFALVTAGYPASASGHEYPARHELNICNRGASGVGAQLELSRDLRSSAHEKSIADSVRSAIASHNART